MSNLSFKTAHATFVDLAFKSSQGTLGIDTAKGIVECFVAAIGNKDSVGDIIVPGAFEKSLKGRKPRVVWGHDWNTPIGKVLEIYEVGPMDPRLPAKMKAAGVGGLFAKVQFNLNSERGREAFASVAFFGEEQEWSIGYKTLKGGFDPRLQANILQELELFEVSPVLHGANQLTSTVSIKSATGEPQTDEKTMPLMAMDHAGLMRIANMVATILDARKGEDDEDEEEEDEVGTVDERCPHCEQRLPMQVGASPSEKEIDAMASMLDDEDDDDYKGMGCRCGGCGKSAPDDVEVKVGRVLSGRNMAMLQQAHELLSQVLASSAIPEAPAAVEAKSLAETFAEQAIALGDDDLVELKAAQHGGVQVKVVTDHVLDVLDLLSDVDYGVAAGIDTVLISLPEADVETLAERFDNQDLGSTALYLVTE